MRVRVGQGVHHRQGSHPAENIPDWDSSSNGLERRIKRGALDYAGLVSYGLECCENSDWVGNIGPCSWDRLIDRMRKTNLRQ